ncbi:hypothetical protein A6046_00880 [[Haemophilus] ducreyi]|uniref:DUF2857 domain-containing protein n=2 Tax=Haemophilus ducreyi TaxID=730 RepID=Q7VMK6_HAEDU|nr:DUF2857 domain-containing protein [[Haemophilus] ducreyi]AAP95850.1 hypothetical protein HD_0969 [[Haemophilus] ducreyi 35000HP]AKO30873.1 hypothetical protein RY60_03835 [[Haemophilus] ducreyi]AKO32311.1 hypothetical protein RZ57_03840 [[Haemophilus] ducreyi]AKO33765.1 hypothetical protein RZ58_03855 [[Haemophilus] ducreyi]AKO35213.1 hypothetical protein RZ59_03820 [[Haemophilus] ducreyi]
MTMFSSLNQVVLNEILINLQEGNINFCRSIGFSKQELQEIEKLSTEELYDLANSRVSFAKIEINHEAFWKLVTSAQLNSQERRLIDRALMLGASIQMLNSYFGLTTSKVSSRRSLLGKQEPMGRKPAASEEEEKAIWELWQAHKNNAVSVDSTEGLELLIFLAEETGINLTEIWKLVGQWSRSEK